jgi:cell division initiation protein
MDSPAPSQSTLETLRTVEFRLGLKGYNVDEVDEYLEKAAVEAEAMLEQLRQASERLRQASDRIAQLEEAARQEPLPQPQPAPVVVAADPMADETLQRTLVLAQRFVDQTKRESEAEAAEIVAQAENRARAMLGQAEERARHMATESEQRLREEVSRLEGLRTQLAGDVETMARHLDTERNRLRGALSEMLKWIDDNVQPAASLTALRPRGDGGRPVAPRPAQGSRVSTRPVAAAGNGADVGGGDTMSGAQVLDLRGPAGSTPAAGSPPVEHG